MSRRTWILVAAAAVLLYLNKKVADMRTLGYHGTWLELAFQGVHLPTLGGPSSGGYTPAAPPTKILQLW